jgi:single-strand DNA-binding protein
MNHVTIAGNCTRDPELRFSQGGLSIASFGIAYSTRKKGDNGQWEDGETSFFDVTCFGQLADNVAESIHKGDRVIVTGTLKQRSWETKDSGEKRSKVEIIADEVGPSLKWATATVERTAAQGRPAADNREPF